MEFSLSSISNIATDDLEKSVRLLDEALSSEGKSLLRTSRNSPLRRTPISRRRGGNYGSDRYSTGNTSVRWARNIHDLSITCGPDDMNALFHDQTTGVLLREQAPWKNVTNKLYVEFLESLQSHGTERQVFDTVADFIQNCTDTLEVLRNMERKMAQRIHSLPQSEDWLQEERNTWRLVYCLYQNRISSHLISADGHRQTGEEIMDIAQVQQSEKEIVQQLYKNDNITRECQLVIDWLEQNALDSMRDEACLQHFTDKTIAWENTLHQLQNKSHKIPYGSSRPIVSKIDPDAPLRENKPLHDIDMEDEVRLEKEVFVQIRCGRLEQAQLLCMHTGQEWRAAALEGWRLFNDPNYRAKGENGTEKLPIDGNPNRDIWKLMAWQLAEDKRMPLHTRATFGSLCGHLSSLIAVCKTWEDLLWAYLRTLVDIRVEKEIRSSSVYEYVQLPDNYWRNEIDIEEVFSELAASKEEDIRKGAFEMVHRIQQFLILDQVGTLMNEMEKWIKLPGEERPQSLRFLSHLILFFRLIGRAEKEDIGDAVIQAYVKELMQMRDSHLVAHYVAKLPQEDQVLLYAEFLADITESSERELALSAAEEADLDIETITRTVVENIRNQETTPEMPDLHAGLTPEDMVKVSALDWVVYYTSQRAEAIWQANALVRHFLAVSKLEAARKAFNKIPVDSIDLIMKQYQSIASDNLSAEYNSVTQNLPPKVSSSIREYLCYKAYLDAQEGFSDWFEHYHHAMPVAPKLPSADVPFTEKVAFDHRRNQYKSELERWKMAMQQQTKTVKSQLYNVLTFPAGGWLVDSSMPETDDDDVDPDNEMNRRQKQMEDLRQLCIPKVVLLLHKVMHEMEEYTECIQLADLIASEQHKLYKVFNKSKLRELLDRISESSLALMDQKRDPWGHPVSS
ncbi:nuclear pore complex protein Nup107 [Periplaneta americana]|uniref:nuclear pore complex protein Nup107 n=1 Tax=Periplaneta americana TaxID=6978 RepID=UPI0037E87B2D